MKSVGQSISKGDSSSFITCPSDIVAELQTKKKQQWIYSIGIFLQNARNVRDNDVSDIGRTEVGTGPQVLQTREWPIRR